MAHPPTLTGSFRVSMSGSLAGHRLSRVALPRERQANVWRKAGERLAKGWRKLALAEEHARHASGGETHDLRAQLVVILTPAHYTTSLGVWSAWWSDYAGAMHLQSRDPTAARLDTPTPVST